MKRPYPSPEPVRCLFIVRPSTELYSREEAKDKALGIQRELRVGLHDPNLTVVVEFGGDG